MGETEAWTLGAHCVWGGWLPSPLREEKETGVASLWTPWSSSRTTCYPEKRGRTPEALRCEDAGAVLMCCGSNSPEWKDTASSPHVAEDHCGRRRTTSPERKGTASSSHAVEDHLTWRRTTTHGGRPLHTQEDPLPSGRTPSPEPKDTASSLHAVTARGGGPPP